MKKDSSSVFIERLDKTVLYVIMVLGVVMLVVALAHVFWRYALNSALTWSEELLKILLVWFALLCSTTITRKSEHVGIVVFREMMPVKTQKLLLRLIRYLMLITCIVVTGIGIYFVTRSMGQNTPSLRIPYSATYASIPVSFTIMAIYEIYHIKNKDFMDADIKK